ncbi:hypothetical protein TNIN_225451 [Trichonephila inaurata madagascariensis]|uniref:Uncharacterized protein n=1 Tax=Trichonephila inaurata madagascariensis TaxID=2747483 RepID=A0A8X7CQU4_9ARAC|nr:hypothetical protein TNIN_225451 [Trichonephila inaurata madagascariensis]
MSTPVQSCKKKPKVVRHLKAHTSSQSSPTSEELKVCSVIFSKSYINEKESERRGFSKSQNSNNYKYSCQYCDYRSNVANNIIFHSKFCSSGLQDVIYYSNNQSSDVINNMDVRQRIRGEDFYLQLGENHEEMGELSESLSNDSAVEAPGHEEPDYSIVYQDGMKKKIDEADLRRQTKMEKVKSIVLRFKKLQ